MIGQSKTMQSQQQPGQVTKVVFLVTVQVRV